MASKISPFSRKYQIITWLHKLRLFAVIAKRLRWQSFETFLKLLESSVYSASCLRNHHVSRWRLRARKQFSNYNWTDEKNWAYHSRHVDKTKEDNSRSQTRAITFPPNVLLVSPLAMISSSTLWDFPKWNGRTNLTRQGNVSGELRRLITTTTTHFYSGIVNISTRERCNEGKSISESQSTILPHSTFCVFLIR